MERLQDARAGPNQLQPAQSAIYLSRRRRRTETVTAHPQRFFTLRNFPLHLDQMLDLNLHIDSFARIMAAALTVMHWAVLKPLISTAIWSLYVLLYPIVELRGAMTPILMS